MKKDRRNFLKFTSLASLTIGSGITKTLAAELAISNSKTSDGATDPNFDEKHLSIIGLYGEWASSLTEKKLPPLSYRRKEFSGLDAWRKIARTRVIERMGIPAIGDTPQVKINKQYEYDGLHIEELTWQLPYGRPTEAILLKPLGQSKPLPGVLAFHDHGGNKYFGARKISRTSDNQHPLMKTHQQEYYEGLAWANEIAKRGFVVLVPDAFTFASRRVMLQDVPQDMRQGLNDEDAENPDNIEAYNK